MAEFLAAVDLPRIAGDSIQGTGTGHTRGHMGCLSQRDRPSVHFAMFLKYWGRGKGRPRTSIFPVIEVNLWNIVTRNLGIPKRRITLLYVPVLT